MSKAESESKCPVNAGRGRDGNIDLGIGKDEHKTSSQSFMENVLSFFSTPKPNLSIEEEGRSKQNSACPIQMDREINPRNLMPENNRQLPHPGQNKPLSTYRVKSGIPKGDFTPEHQQDSKTVKAEEEGINTWWYPSEQQFYSALKRKGLEAREEDMKVVVAIHNHVNDTAWEKILEYEQLHCDDCQNPKLIKFMGKPKELSPKATIRSWLGYARPFDRHDWTVDRCGKTVRYIIDFYNGQPTPEAQMQGAVSMYMDVRPALDSFEALIDRARMTMNEYLPSKPKR